MNDKYNDINIFNTLENEENQEELFNLFLDNINTRKYNMLKKFITKERIDTNFLDNLNETIINIFGVNIQNLFVLDHDLKNNSLKVYINFLNFIHNDLPKYISEVLKNNNFTEIHQLDNINLIIKKIGSKSNNIFRLLDYDTAYNILNTIWDIYKFDYLV